MDAIAPVCFCPMAALDVLSLFRQSGALLDGHFRLTSGLHSPGYLQSALVLQHPRHAETIGRALADRVRSLTPTVVLSPALGGLIIGHEVARALEVRAIFAERQDGRLVLRRGFSLAPADRVVVIEDVVTTGGSTRETMTVATGAGATVVGGGSIIDRSGGTSGLGVPFHPLVAYALPTYEPTACPLCQTGSPVVKPGSRT
jgi:orotate phosphoribosyltransferase